MNQEEAARPLCFVLMPFGVRPDAQGTLIDFDRIYAQLLEPAVRQAGMSPIRGDEEQLGGLIHKAIFERLILCDYAVADLTCANPNVLYELGVRHGIRPRTTVSVFAKDSRLPFDVAPLRGVPYSLSAGKPDAAATDIERIASALVATTLEAPDSPVFQLVTDLPPPDLAHLKTDVFRDQALRVEGVKAELAQARKAGSLEAVDAMRDRLGAIDTLEAGIAIDLMLSYRAVGAWDAMVEVIESFAPPLARSLLVREQLGMALNRAGRSEEAERVLNAVIAENGPNSESYGLLGRVYKDRWDQAVAAGKQLVAEGFLRQAIEAYRKGFEADWRDPYPGVNAVTLMEFTDPPDPQQAELLPVVRYSVQRRLSASPDYWNHATLLELAVLARDRDAARRHAADALTSVQEPWQLETTARNLSLIKQARLGRGEESDWLDEILEALRSQ